MPDSITDEQNQPAKHEDEHLAYGFWDDVYGSFNNTLRSQENGAIQLTNKLLGTNISEAKPIEVDDPHSSWGGWSASLLGQAGAMAAEVLLLRRLGRVNPALEVGPLKTGALMGLLTPTDDPNKFWTDRVNNTLSGMMAFSAMSAASAGLARAAGTSAFGDMVSSKYIRNTVSGFVGGTVGDITSMSLRGYAPVFSLDYWHHVGRSGAEFGLFNLAAGGVSPGAAKEFENIPNPPDRPQAKNGPGITASHWAGAAAAAAGFSSRRY